MLMQAIDSYLQLRRAGGYQLRDTEVLLKEFACFAAERGEIHIKADTAIAWASRATSLQQRARRLNSLILFARYIRAEDTDHQVPPSGVFGHPPCSRPLPHIFTPTQIAAILAEAKQLPPAGSLRPLTFYTLFGLVAACGLRISEALALQIDDMRPDGLYIRETKFRISRTQTQRCDVSGGLCRSPRDGKREEGARPHSLENCCRQPASVAFHSRRRERS